MAKWLTSKRRNTANDRYRTCRTRSSPILISRRSCAISVISLFKTNTEGRHRARPIQISIINNQICTTEMIFFIPPSLPRASKSKSQSSRTLPSRIPDTKVSNLTIDWSFQCPGPPLVVCKIWRQWLQVKLKVHRSKSIICGVCMIVGMGRHGGLFLCLGCSSSWMCCGNSLSSCRWCRF